MSAAAKAVGVHRCTVYERRNNVSGFVEACTEARFLALFDTLDELKDLSSLAVQTLKSVLADPKSSSSVRVKASLAILNRLEHTHHEGWALPLSIQEADHTRTERELLHRDRICTEPASRKHAAQAAARRESTETRHNPTQTQKRGPKHPPEHYTTMPTDPCYSNSGRIFLKCRFRKAALAAA